MGTLTFFFTDETGSRWTPREVWSYLFPNLVFAVLSRCRWRHRRLPRPLCTPSRHAPARFRSQSAGNLDAMACWAGVWAGRSSHLRYIRERRRSEIKPRRRRPPLRAFYPPASACTEGWSWVLRSCAWIVSTTLLNLRLGPNRKEIQFQFNSVYFIVLFTITFSLGSLQSHKPRVWTPRFAQWYGKIPF